MRRPPENKKALEIKDFSYAALISAKVAKNKQGRVALSPEDIGKIYQAAIDKKKQSLADLIALGAYTGARIRAIAHLRVTDITESQSLLIRSAKTKAGVREIPIHPAISGLVERLKKNAEFEFLIPGDAVNQYGNRPDAIGKSFGRLTDSMGYAKKSEVFHSIRKTLITLPENAGVSEGVSSRHRWA